jgi:hypothetical protein
MQETDRRCTRLQQRRHCEHVKNCLYFWYKNEIVFSLWIKELSALKAFYKTSQSFIKNL